MNIVRGFITFIVAVMLAECSFGVDYIFRTKQKGIEVQEYNFGASVISFSVSGPDADGYVTLTANTAAASSDIIKTKLRGTDVQAFTPTGGYIYGFSILGPDADGYVTLTALSTGSKASGDILRTRLKGTDVQAYPGNTDNPVQGFKQSTPDADGYVGLGLGPFATELIGWDCVYRNGVVEVNWATEVELGVYKWVVHRKEEGDVNYVRICEKSSQDGGNYMWVDSTVLGGRWYWYQLGEFNGSDIIWHGEQKVWVPARIKVPLSLSMIPNPAGATSKLRLQYSVPGIVESSGRSISPDKEINLKVYDSAGRVVRILIDGQKGAGYYTMEWDIKTDNGDRVASGTYFVKLEVQADGKKKELKKVIVVR